MTEDAESDPDGKDGGEAHKEIEQALRFYCQFPHAQGFAVMLDGPWGSGKTRFIKSLKGSLAPPQSLGEPEIEPLYVSLYGMSSYTQIDDAIFQQLHPILSSKPVRFTAAIIRGVSKGVAKFDPQSLEEQMSSMLLRASGRIIIFDDFERTEITASNLLGYVNGFVEHEGCKVIIIADQSKIDDKHYIEKKEKTIGRTFNFIPDVEAALPEFLLQIDDTEARSFLESSEEDILGTFRSSEKMNLRLLKQSLWDFELLWKSLAPNQRAHRAAMKELVSLVIAAALELRSGRLSEGDYVVLKPEEEIVRMMSRKDAPPDPLESVQARYPTVDFASTLLSPDTIKDCVLRSRVVPSDIQRQVGQHPLLRKPGDSEVPSWRALWQAYEASSDQHSDIVQRFEDDFAARRFREQPLIYHVFGLALWLVKIGFPGWPEAEIEDRLKTYVDDVFKSSVPTGDDVAEEQPFDLVSGGYDGLGFRCHEDQRFRELVTYERSQRSAWRQMGYAVVAANLKQLALDDSEQFLRLVCRTAAGPSSYADVGVLSLIPAQEFAAILVKAHYRDQSKIAMALRIRYEHLNRLEIAKEMPWLRIVKKEVDQQSDALPPIAKDALRMLVGHYIATTLEQHPEG